MKKTPVKKRGHTTVDDRSHKEELRCVGRLTNSASIADRKKAPRNRSKAVAAPTDGAVRCQVRLGLRCSMEYCHLADEDLIASIEAQNTESFATLYDRHSRVAYSLAYRMTGEHQAAEDLVQEAFLKVWRAAGSYRAERGSARTWVLSIVHNHGIDQLRSTARRRKIQDRAEAILPTSQPSEVFAETWRNSQREQVVEALRGLPPEQLKVLELAYFSGYTNKEIAELLDLPLGTVKGRMRLGLKKIREYFDSRGMAL